MREDIESFLDEYELLVRKYGMCINACGCCDGPKPYVFVREEAYITEEDHLRHLREYIDEALAA